jgi:hypothetical protein
MIHTILSSLLKRLSLCLCIGMLSLGLIAPLGIAQPATPSPTAGDQIELELGVPPSSDTSTAEKPSTVEASPPASPKPVAKQEVKQDDKRPFDPYRDFYDSYREYEQEAYGPRG